MKRYFKKIILIFMVIVLLTPNFAKVVLAADDDEAKSKRSNFSDVIDSYSKDSYGALADEGKADIKESSDDQSGELPIRTQTTLAPVDMSLPSAANVVCSILNLILRTVQGIVTIIFVDREDDSSTMSFFTIYDLLAGKYAIFNANFMDFEPVASSSPGISITYVFNSGKEVNNAFKSVVSQWFQIIKNISYILALCVLIYVGIRMAISTVAAEQAKYKKMLIDWLAGMVVIIIMPYIISIASFVSDALINIFSSFLETNDNFENVMVEEIAFKLPNDIGWSALIITLEYLALVAIQIRFALMYIKRFLALGFLIIIGPIVTVTYAIDSIGDGKAQAFNNWLKELLRNLFVQPLHLIIYLVFLGSAGEIFENFHLLGIIFLLSLTRIEKILLKLFSMSGSLTVGTLQDQKISSKGIL